MFFKTQTDSKFSFFKQKLGQFRVSEILSSNCEGIAAASLLSEAVLFMDQDYVEFRLNIHTELVKISKSQKQSFHLNQKTNENLFLFVH